MIVIFEYGIKFKTLILLLYMYVTCITLSSMQLHCYIHFMNGLGCVWLDNSQNESFDCTKIDRFGDNCRTVYFGRRMWHQKGVVMKRQLSFDIVLREKNCVLSPLDVQWACILSVQQLFRNGQLNAKCWEVSVDPYLQEY